MKAWLLMSALVEWAYDKESQRKRRLEDQSEPAVGIGDAIGFGKALVEPHGDPRKGREDWGERLDMSDWRSGVGCDRGNLIWPDRATPTAERERVYSVAALLYYQWQLCREIYIPTKPHDVLSLYEGTG